MRRLILITAVAALAVAPSACGKEAAPEPPPATAQPSPAPIPLVSIADLRASVPEFTGWIKGEIAGQETSTPERSAHVVVTFTRGNQKLEMEIADTGGLQRAIESLEHIAGSDTNRTVGNGYFKGTRISNFPAVESWNTVEKLGELSVLIRRRFIIHVAGSGLANAEPMRALAEAVDTSRLR